MIKRYFTIYSLALVLILSQSVSAKHFELKYLEQAKNPTFDLADYADQTAYYDYVRNTLGPRMQKAAPKMRLNNETELTKGRGISVKLSENNFNIHINFPNASTGGRSYGWTAGEVGDWSDAMYLDNLSAALANTSEDDIEKFYALIVQVLGACRSGEIEALEINTQLVFNNFLAIYTAEAYRAMVPDAHKNWDEALLQTTLLAAFHSGQTRFAKFYVGEFSSTSRKQNSGVYNRGRPGVSFNKAPKKKAELRDYWQFSADPESKRSGINITRNDFEKMGQMITKYERSVARNATIERIFAVTGGPKNNVIKAIADFFSEGKSKDIAQIDGLSKDVASLMMDLRTHADEISQYAERRDLNLEDTDIE